MLKLMKNIPQVQSYENLAFTKHQGDEDSIDSENITSIVEEIGHIYKNKKKSKIS